jgi:hypothetical protein
MENMATGYGKADAPAGCEPDRRRGLQLVFARMYADFLNGCGGNSEEFEETLVRVGMTLFEERMQALFLRVGDANLVEEGDELVFCDFLHGFKRWL